MYETIKKYLEEQPQDRERKNKNRAIDNLIIKKYMQDMVGDILSADRAWRKVLEENINLRGTNYGDKDDLEIIKQRELGYKV